MAVELTKTEIQLLKRLLRRRPSQDDLNRTPLAAALAAVTDHLEGEKILNLKRA